jgi:hypothetical protein
MGVLQGGRQPRAFCLRDVNPPCFESSKKPTDQFFHCGAPLGELAVIENHHKEESRGPWGQLGVLGRPLESLETPWRSRLAPFGGPLGALPDSPFKTITRKHHEVV